MDIVYTNRVVSHLYNPKYIIDIGAHIGNFSKGIYNHYKDCRFMLIEANKNCETHLQNLPFEYQIVALSDGQTQSDLFIEKSNPIATGASLKKENTVYYDDGKFDTVQVTTNTLDNLCLFEKNLVDLLKLDTQGSELDILRGGIKTLHRSKLVLLEVSTLEYNQNAPLFDVIFDFMKINSFEILDIINFLRMDNGQNKMIVQMDVLFKNSRL